VNPNAEGDLWLADGNTVVSVSSTGPFAMTYVNPSDDPTKVMATP